MSNTPHETLGERLRRARGDMKLRELARRLGLAPSYLSDIENDRRIPSEQVLGELATELGVDFEELMALAGRVGTQAERFLRRSPAATTLFRKIYERKLTEAEIQTLGENLDNLRKRKAHDK